MSTSQPTQDTDSAAPAAASDNATSAATATSSKAVAPSSRPQPLQGAELFSAIESLTTKILSASPVYSHLLSSLSLQSASPGQVTYIWPQLPAHCLNSHHTLHGAVSATLIDFLGGPVIASTSSNPLEAKRGVSTDISAQYLREAKEGERVRIVGRAKKVGKRLAWVGVEIWAGGKEGGPEGGEGGERLCVEGSHTKFIA
ncbi:Thioesterase/thiol ester dehydrase-isomerase [Jaminaea rosea]|uniref:Thioesterase/thiol ester dehydrase-isomerase n=1 Tax=Jaminaea rosea TaxID=1569628 RepID=A0A316UKE5_9BASI|nr:Thioesterase/thiol ester dehydrase-isomerase [Jaminaea rosea]PWN25727.1 Thioesterase/thiol ester dehydrase-isomerase [Jaminaea rosea]